MCSKMLLGAAMSCNDVRLELEDDGYVVMPPLSFKVLMMEKLRMTKFKVMKLRQMTLYRMSLLNLMRLK